MILHSCKNFLTLFLTTPLVLKHINYIIQHLEVTLFMLISSIPLFVVIYTYHFVLLVDSISEPVLWQLQYSISSTSEKVTSSPRVGSKPQSEYREAFCDCVLEPLSSGARGCCLFGICVHVTYFTVDKRLDYFNIILIRVYFRLQGETMERKDVNRE